MLTFCDTDMSLIKLVFLYLQCLFYTIDCFFKITLVEIYSSDTAGNKRVSVLKEKIRFRPSATLTYEVKMTHLDDDFREVIVLLSMKRGSS
jgi:hypothetical protein